MRTISLRELISLRLECWTKPARQLFWKMVEDHYNICAETEDKRAKEHHHNASYYGKKAGLARSRRISVR